MAAFTNSNFCGFAKLPYLTKVTKNSYFLKATFFKKPKTALNIWATFVRIFVAIIFQKYSNLVTLFVQDQFELILQVQIFHVIPH